MEKKLSMFFVVPLLIVITGSSAPAYTISETQFIAGTPSMNGSLTFKQFDNHNGLWDLQSIQVSFTLQSSGGYLEVHNISSSLASIIYSFGVNGYISSTDVYLPDMSLQAFDTNHFDLTPGATWSYNGSTETDTDLDPIAEVLWGNGAKGFLGTDTYKINYAIGQIADCDSNNDISFFSIPASASGLVTVLYTYDVVPEPATIILMTIGTLGLLKRKSG